MRTECAPTRQVSPTRSPGAGYADYGFLVLLREDGELDFAFLDAEDRVRRIALGEEHLALAIVDRSAFAGYGSQEKLGI